MIVTSSLLYDYYNCPHKVWRDKYGPKQEEIQEDNPFVKLLWERGIQHEKEIIKIFHYEDEIRQKKHYAIQLCLYLEILEGMGISKERKGFIIDRDGNKVEYNLNAQMGVRTPSSYWDLYSQIKNEVSELISNRKQNEPAMCAACKLCSWYDSCKKWCATSDDITQIFYVGRKVRDTLKKDAGVTNVTDLINLDATELLSKKKKNKEFLKGIGEGTLNSAIKRGKLLKHNSEPVIYSIRHMKKQFTSDCKKNIQK